MKNNLSEKEKEEYDFLTKPLELSYVEELGGTTPVSIGNACFSCSGCYANAITTQFKNVDLNILQELLEASNELNVNYFPAKKWGKSTNYLSESAKELGFEVEPMPKFIDFEKCKNCGQCVSGCEFNAKWDSTNYIEEILKLENVELLTEFKVTEIIQENYKIIGVKGINKDNEEKFFKSHTVILSAGAINTPLILKNSGIKNVGEELFFDIFTTIGGYYKEANLKNELMMGIKSEFGPYFLSPHYSSQLLPMIKEKGFDATEKDVIGLMLKFADAREGKINNEQDIEKKLTTKDIDLIKEGYEKAVKILINLGVDKKSIVATRLKGAHPGGTAAVGKIVNTNFETEIEGLYVSDASVIPEAPGRPPILTIVAISKKVAKIVNEKLLKKE